MSDMLELVVTWPSANWMVSVVLFHTRQAKELLAKLAGLKFDLSFTHALAWGSAPNVFRSNRFNGLPAGENLSV